MERNDLMSFYPNNWLLHFFNSDYLNQIVTLIAYISVYMIVLLSLQRRLKNQIGYYVSNGTLQNSDDSDLTLKRLTRAFYLVQYIVMGTTVFALVLRSEILTVIAQLTFTAFVLLRIIIQAKRAWTWTKRRKSANSQLEPENPKRIAFKKTYRTFLLCFILPEILWVPVYLVAMDLINQIPIL